MCAVEYRPFSNSSTSTDSSFNVFKDIQFSDLESPPEWSAELFNKKDEKPGPTKKYRKNLKKKEKLKPKKIRAQRPTTCAVCERPASCCHYGKSGNFYGKV